MIRHLFPMGDTAAPRQLVFDAVVSLINDARQLTDEELTHSPGFEIATNIVSILAWQLQGNGITNTWFTEEKEPALSRVLDKAGKLDNENDDLETWRELLAIDLNGNEFRRSI